MPNPSSVLSKLGLSDSEVELYQALHAFGALTAKELVKLTHNKRPTVYYALHQLMERGLVHRGGAPGVERFQADPPEKLVAALDIRRRELESLEADIKAIIPALIKSKTPHEGVPAVSFYEGDAAMKQAILETLYCRSGHIDSIAPSDNFFWQIGQTFSGSYIKERVARKISTRNLWEKTLEPEIMLRSYEGLSEVRILPKSMHGKFLTTVFLFDDKVMYISSRKSGYVLVVKSKEHYELMRATYEALWEASTRVTAGGRRAA